LVIEYNRKMEQLFQKSRLRLNAIQTGHVRNKYEQIDWSDRLIGILGPRGTGKTTLLLQHLKLNQTDTAIYLSLDDVYFTNHSLIDLVEEFRLQGGRKLYLDEIHKYPGWSREVKNIYDTWHDISIIFTGSSIINIFQQEGDLSRRAVFYELPGLSFREFLSFEQVYELPKTTLPDLLKNHGDMAADYSQQFSPVKYWEQYIRYGYYPFYKENLNTYPLRLEQVIRLILEDELRFVEGFDLNNVRKIYQLLSILASNVPFKPNISKLSEKIGINRLTLVQYIHYLEKARLINTLSAVGKSISILQKPDKIYLENPNLHQVLTPGKTDKGSLRESFFLNQLRNAGHEVELPKQGDFMIDETYTFEVGGKSKSFTQLKGLKNAFIAADDMEIGGFNKIPLWMFGLLY